MDEFNIPLSKITKNDLKLIDEVLMEYHDLNKDILLYDSDDMTDNGIQELTDRVILTEMLHCKILDEIYGGRND